MSDPIPPARFTTEEKDALRRAVFGALAYVSRADPGFLAGFRESAEGTQGR